ncbi:hypothetical protein FC83_GL003079 [Agrilactobacillus composti DSM 18527 = JCM 14202]|uniref:NlpC/P60 domain-containing protein n=1 Tax=Agrilactobacillus composti DSM 18527 = JCM 14202 TaxID=1423734 RepID=A0A0R1Y6A1_9LACO|nr:hypothetical protein FC83_GL003079 [Agrilactobacillus composti DSM 18527 = JCM 14202]
MEEYILNLFKKVTLSIAAAGMLGVSSLALNNNTNTAQAATTGDVVTVSWDGEAASAYAKPTEDSNVTNYLGKATSWKVVAVQKDGNGQTWYEVGANQWLPASVVTDGWSVSQAPVATNATTDAQKVIDLAKQQIGKPYVWGAKGPNSFDCSGLMHYVFQQALGKEIGGWTVPQESAGTQVSVENAQAGDLLFWGGHGATYHVALALGNGQYLHAPQPGQNVTIANISPYFWPSFAVHVN